MSKYETKPPTPDELEVWGICDSIDPRTGRELKKTSKTYKILKESYDKLILSKKSVHLPSSIQSDQLDKIDFDNPFGEKKTSDHKEEHSLYKFEDRLIDYDRKTMVYYKTMRMRRADVISQDDLSDEQLGFPFQWQWNPYSGERIIDRSTGLPIKDPYGPLMFDVHHLIRYFYLKRLENLYVSNGPEYEGYYGDGVGASENFEIKSRGAFPEWYLFRIPIMDCYLTNDHNNSFPTMGCKLTDEEINEIYQKAKKFTHRYTTIYRHNLPNLVEMKRQYDIAINPDPELPASLKADKYDPKQAKEQINRNAVEVLRQMR
jgi:hypothetical protein